MNPEILSRKGARKVQDIPEDVLALLNTGQIETVNLTEWLAIDHVHLIKHTFHNFGLASAEVDYLSERILAQKKPTAMSTIKTIGGCLYELGSKQNTIDLIFGQLSRSQSDSVRCYAPYLISLNTNLSVEEKLSRSENLAADKHFGVREVVWMALRPELDKHLDQSIVVLSKWANHADENIRRFASESIRPRGVWCSHIQRLKENPSLAMPILDKLKADESKYVQDSVGNWLNDASKSQPDFVIQLCERWLKESPTKSTERIVNKAKRTLIKAAATNQ